MVFKTKFNLETNPEPYKGYALKDLKSEGRHSSIAASSFSSLLKSAMSGSNNTWDTLWNKEAGLTQIKPLIINSLSDRELKQDILREDLLKEDILKEELLKEEERLRKQRQAENKNLDVFSLSKNSVLTKKINSTGIADRLNQNTNSLISSEELASSSTKLSPGEFFSHIENNEASNEHSLKLDAVKESSGKNSKQIKHENKSIDKNSNKNSKEDKINSEKLLKTLVAFDIKKNSKSLLDASGSESAAITAELNSTSKTNLNSENFTSNLLSDLLNEDSRSLSENIFQKRMSKVRSSVNHKNTSKELSDAKEENGKSENLNSKNSSVARAKEEVQELKDILSKDTSTLSDSKTLDDKVYNLKEAVSKELKQNSENALKEKLSLELKSTKQESEISKDNITEKSKHHQLKLNQEGVSSKDLLNDVQELELVLEQSKDLKNKKNVKAKNIRSSQLKKDSINIDLQASSSRSASNTTSDNQASSNGFTSFGGNSSFAKGSLSSKAAGSGSSVSTWKRANVDALVQQARISLAKNGTGTVSIRMNPKILGHVSLTIRLVKNQLKGRIRVETAEAHAVFKEQLEQLKEELAKSGVEIQEFTLEQFSSNDNQQADNTSSQEKFFGDKNLNLSLNENASEEDLRISEEEYLRSTKANSQKVNIRI